MKINMGHVDRGLRTTVAGLLSFLYIVHVFQGTWEKIILGFAAVLLLTSIFGICPLYSLFGINTCKKVKSS